MGGFFFQINNSPIDVAHMYSAYVATDFFGLVMYSSELGLFCPLNNYRERIYVPPFL